MNVFILGSSGSGKSTLAIKVQELLSPCEKHEAGAWARKSFPCPKGMEASDYIPWLSKQASMALVDDPLISVKYMKQSLSATKNNVIAGVRNPVDLIHLADPKVDKFLWANYKNNPFASGFEAKGLTACEAVLDFWLVTGQLSPSHYLPKWTPSHHPDTLKEFLAHGC